MILKSTREIAGAGTFRNINAGNSPIAEAFRYSMCVVMNDSTALQPSARDCVMSSLPVRKLTPEEYLEIERQAEFKSEFYRGEMFAMSGAGRAHNLIANNIGGEARSRLRGRPCEVYGSDMRARVSTTGPYTYPDATIACDKPQFVDDRGDTLLTPKVLFEVLSETTEKYDRGAKSNQYRQIESLQEYVLVSQSEPHVEVFQRCLDGKWLFSEARELLASITTESLGVTLPLSEIYLRVEFPDSVAAAV